MTDTERLQVDDRTTAPAVRPSRDVQPEGENGRTSSATGVAQHLSKHWPMTVVTAVYVMAALVLPTLTPVAISDDWTYTRSVEILFREDRFHILDIAGANAVFQILWGAPFAAVLDVFGGLRVATVTFVGISGVAFYVLCGGLSLGRPASALGAAAYLFNPLGFVLSYTFMTDPYFTGLVVIAAACYVHGLAVERSRATAAAATFVGSVVASVAIAQRELGVFLPVAAVMFIVATARFRISAGVLRRVALASLFPAVFFVIFSAWIAAVRGADTGRAGFASAIVEAGPDELWLLARRLAFIELIYIGLFAMPLLVVGLPRLRRAVQVMPRGGWAAFIPVCGATALGLWYFVPERRMPLVPHFLSRAGLGPDDLVASRGFILGDAAATAGTVACAVLAVVAALAVCCALARREIPGWRGAQLVGCLLVWQMFAALIPSVGFRNWSVAGQSAPSLDRYLLPLMPLSILLVLWALRAVGLSLRAATVAVALVGVFSVVGTHDALELQRQTWALARHANRIGIDNTRLDAGFAWDAYHLHEFSVANKVTSRTPHPPWWVAGFAPATDSSYVVAMTPIPGYHVVARRPVSLWLENDPTALFLLRRGDVAPPP